MGGRGERRRKGDEAKRYGGVGGSKEDRKEVRMEGIRWNSSKPRYQWDQLFCLVHGGVRKSGVHSSHA